MSNAHNSDNINVEVDENLPTFEIDKVQLEQVFQNLISNAIKFIDKEHGLITVKYIKNEIEHIFAVEDNGPGIDEKYFDKIFNIFQTLKPRDEFESTGVGLSIVKKIIENLDGKVWLESKIGEGTTFYFSIPKQNNKNQ